MYPQARGSANLTLEDVAQVKGNSDAGKMKIPDELYADTIIERHELLRWLGSEVQGEIKVYGSATRVLSENRQREIRRLRGQWLVESGRSMKVTVNAGAIVIELDGTAAGSGMKGDTIDVTLRGGRKVKAKIISEDHAEATL